MDLYVAVNTEKVPDLPSEVVESPPEVHQRYDCLLRRLRDVEEENEGPVADVVEWEREEVVTRVREFGDQIVDEDGGR